MPRRTDSTVWRRARIARLVASAGLGPAMLVATAAAGPTGATVVAGQATVRQNGSLTTITASNGAVINYQSFGVARGETVRFVQPDASSRVLNRVTGPDPSVFAGTLTANGIVYIVNPSGVYFRAGALVNVGGIYAAAARLNDADFARGIDRFTHVSGSVVNQGFIDAGSVVLVGSGVLNSGQIRTSGGPVVMACGDDVLVGERGSNVYVNVSRSKPTDQPAGEVRAGTIENRGVIQAPGGRVTLAAGDTFGVALRNSGAIRARSVELRAGRQGRADVSGTIDVSQSSARGGDVTITGRDIELQGATIDASGTTGGDIRIGGERQGGVGLDRAQNVSVDASSSLRADGLSGDGGRIIVWSDGLTRFNGLASATGAAGTHGGFIETSGREALQINQARVYASAAGGEPGTWLMDPAEIAILIAPTSGGAFSGGNPDVFQATAGLSFVDVQTITNSLSAGTSVEISTYAPGQTGLGNITVYVPIVAAMNNGPATLTLRAARNIQFSVLTGVVSLGSALNVVLSANDGTGSGVPEPTPGTGGVQFSALANIVTRGGTISTSGAFFTAAAGATVFDTTDAGGIGAGAVTMNHTGPVTVDAGMITGPASINTSGAGGAVIIRGGWRTRGGGALTINNSGLATIDFLPLTLDGALNQTGAGSVVVRENITTTNDAISFARPVLLGGAGGSMIALNTGSGAVTFGDTLDSEPASLAGLSTVGSGLVTFAADVGQASALGSLTTAPGGAVRFGSASTGGAPTIAVRTQGGGGIDLGGPVTLDAATTMTALLSGVRVRSSVDSAGAPARSLSIVSSGATQLEGTIGAINPLESLLTDAPGTLRIGGGAGPLGITTSGAAGVDFGEPTTLASDATINAGIGGIRFHGAVNSNGSARELRLNSAGLTRLDASVGAASPLARFDTDAPGTTLIGGAQVTASGPVNILDPLTLGITTTITASGAGASFGQGVAANTPGVEALTVIGPATFDAGAGTALSPLRSLTISGPANLSGTFRTSTAGGGSSSQTYSGAATLVGDTVIDSGPGPVLFSNELDGAHALTILPGAGAASFADAVGATTPLASITVSRAGGYSISGGAVTTGAQQWTGPGSVSGIIASASAPIAFNGSLLLGANTTLNTAAGGGADITVTGTINGSRALLADAGAGELIFGSAIGGLAPLASVTAAADQISLQGVTTTGAQGYTAVTGTSVGAGMSGLGIAFTGPVTAAPGVLIDAGTGTLSIGGPLAAGNGVTLQGDEVELLGAVSGAGTLAIQPTTISRAVRVGAAADSPGAFDLLQAELAQLQPGFASVRIGRTNGSGTLTAAGPATFNSPVTLSMPAGSIVTQAAINAVGSASLTLDAGTLTTLGGNLLTEGGTISIESPVRLNAPAVVIDTTGAGAPGGTVTVAGSIDGVTPGVSALTINSGAAAISISGAIGQIVPLASVAFTGSSLSTGASIITTGAQSFDAPVVLNNDLSLVSTAGPISFLRTVDGARNLTINSAGPITFVGAVGGGTPVGSGVGLAIASLGAGTVEFQGPVTSAGPLSTTGPATFQQAVNITAPGASTFANAVEFLGTLTSAGTLTVNGAATFRDDVALAGAGVTQFNGDVLLDGLNFSAAGPVTFGLNSTRQVTLSGGPVTIGSSGGAVVFNGRVDGAQNLTLTGNQGITFNSTIGATTPLGTGGAIALTRTGAGPTIFNGAVTTAGAVNIQGPATIAQAMTLGAGGGGSTFSGLTSVSAPLIVAAGGVTFAGGVNFVSAASSVTTTNAPILFSGPVNGPASLTLNSGTAATSLAAPVGATTALGRLVTGTGQTNLGTTVRSTGGVVFNGPTVLTGDTTITAVSGPMYFLGPIDSDAAIGGRSLTLLTGMPVLRGLVTDVQLRAYQPPIGFAANIGATRPLRSLLLNVNQSGSIDGRAEVPSVATVVFANSLTANGRIPVASTNLATPFVVRTLDRFTMGFREKLTAFGSLSIFADRASLGDITAMGNLSVTAPSAIELRARESDNVIGYSDTNIPTIATDTGVDYVVAGGTVSFSRVPVAVNSAGAPVAGPQNAPTFSTPGGGGDAMGTLNGFLFRAFGAGLSVGLTQDRPAPNNTLYMPLDLRSEGPTRTNVSETIAPFVVVDLPNVPDQTSVGAAMRRQLEEIAIFVRALGTSELIEFLVGRSLYNDRAGTSRPAAGDTLVSIGRLSMDLVRSVLDEYRVISDQKVEVQSALQMVLEAYVEQFPDEDFDPIKFEKFLASRPEDDPARTNLVRLASVFRKVEQLGLGPVELRDCKRAIVSGLLPGEVSAAEMVAVVDAFNATGTTGRVAPAEGPLP